MERLAPLGPVYQAGTLSGNPVAVAAGIASLELARDEDPYPDLQRRASQLADGIRAALAEAGVAATVNRAATLLSVFFTEGPVTDYADARAADQDRYARFFHGMLEGGVALAPSGFEAWFPSAAHGDAEIERTLEVVRAAAGPLGS